MHIYNKASKMRTVKQCIRLSERLSSLHPRRVSRPDSREALSNLL